MILTDDQINVAIALHELPDEDWFALADLAFPGDGIGRLIQFNLATQRQRDLMRLYQRPTP